MTQSYTGSEKSQSFHIEGLNDSIDRQKVRAALSQLVGVRDVDLSQDSSDVSVRYDPDRLDEELIAQAIDLAGYSATTPAGGGSSARTATRTGIPSSSLGYEDPGPSRSGK